MKRLQHLGIFILFALGLANRAGAQVVVRSDSPYFRLWTNEVLYIYPEEHRPVLPELAHYTQYFMRQYEKSFQWILDERVKLSLASSRNQIANGFATVTPFLMTTHYPSGSELLDLFAEDSFLFALASHETAHLYQLSAKSRLSSMVKSILGNVPFVITPIVPIFVFPNAFLPTFILEGNAVMNESVVGHGGRLWSGEVRAEVLAQLRAFETGPERLINQEIDFPLSEAYHQGGYFAAFLADRFGIDKSNAFFKSHAERDFWPFNMNKTFRQHFGHSYSRLMYEFKMWMKPYYERQRLASANVLERTFTRPRMNHSEQEIFFVANPSGRESNYLYRWNKQNGKMTKEQTALPNGKLFRQGDEWQTVSSELVNPSLRRYSLFNENLRPNPKFNDQIVLDQRANHLLAASSTQSYAQTQLLKDGAFLDFTASSAILDNQGRSYYFRQVGDERVLYRDREMLFKYKGYYGIPQEVTQEGHVHFIAATPFGASLFRFHAQTGAIERLSQFDNIVEARTIDTNSFLAAAVDQNGFTIQKLEIEPKEELPAVYEYRFQKPLPPAADQNALPPAPFSEEKTFRSVSNLRFSNANIVATGDSVQAALTFTDPLLWNMLQIAARDDESDTDFMVNYINQRHKLGWLLSATYESEKYTSLITGQKHHFQDSFVWLAADYFWLRWRRWSSEFRLGPTWNEDSLTSPDALERRYGGQAQLVLSYNRQDHPAAYDPYRRFDLSVWQRTDIAEETGRKFDSLFGVKSQLSADIGKQTYLNLYGGYAHGEQNSIEVDYLGSGLAQEFQLPTYLSEGDAQEVREYAVTLKQALDISHYYARFPLSLRRVAPFVTFKDTYTQEKTFDFLPHHRQEIQLGSEFELLLFHNMAARVALSFVEFDNHEEYRLRAIFSDR